MLAAQGGFTEQELKESNHASFGWWHHSVENTIDKVDWDHLSVHLRVYVSYLWELCTAIILPFEFSNVAQEFVQQIELFDGSGDVGMRGALECAHSFKSEAMRFDLTAKEWRQRYKSGATRDEAAAERLNACMKRLSRMLIPIGSTSIGAYGHDPYGFTSQKVMLPSLFELSRYKNLSDGAERWMLETKLVRQRNRLVDVMSDCSRMISDTLADLS